MNPIILVFLAFYSSLSFFSPSLTSPSYPFSPSFQLLTTIPLDITLKWVNQPTLSARLTYSSSHIIGLGLRGENPHDTYVLHCTVLTVLYCTERRYFVFSINFCSILKQEKKGFFLNSFFSFFFFKYWKFYKSFCSHIFLI